MRRSPDAGRDGVAFVRLEACLNMPGGQPCSLANLRGGAGADRSARRSDRPGRNADLGEVSVRQGSRARYGGWPLAKVVHELAASVDAAILSSKKDHFVPIGGLLVTRDDELARRARAGRRLRGLPALRGLAGHDLKALGQGVRESAAESLVRHHVDQVALLGEALQQDGVPIVVPAGAHAVYLEAKRFCRTSSAPAARLQPGSPCFHGGDRRRRVRAAARRPGLERTHAPDRLRSFEARFAPLEPFPAFSGVPSSLT